MGHLLADGFRQARRHLGFQFVIENTVTVTGSNIMKNARTKSKFPLKDYAREELLERGSLRVARSIREMLEETGHSHSRLLEGLLFPDSLTEIGRSNSVQDGGCREHVIPCRVIIYRIHEMYEAGKSDEEVAKFIREHVMIVRISEEERRRLDGGESGLKQRMPKGWEFGDDPFARFKTVGIEFQGVGTGSSRQPASSGRAAHAVDVSQVPEPNAVEIDIAIELSDNRPDVIEQGVT